MVNLALGVMVGLIFAMVFNAVSDHLRDQEGFDIHGDCSSCNYPCYGKKCDKRRSDLAHPDEGTTEISK